MRAVVQLVKEANVKIDRKIKAQIKDGFLILLGIEDQDSLEDISWLCHKIGNLRVFADENKKMNRSVQEIDGEFLVVSQFTLHASTKKGNRPSFIRAAKPETAIPLYHAFIKKLQNYSRHEVKTGEFGAMMDVSLLNHGPVTIFIDTKNKE